MAEYSLVGDPSLPSSGRFGFLQRITTQHVHNSFVSLPPSVDEALINLGLHYPLVVLKLKSFPEDLAFQTLGEFVGQGRGGLGENRVDAFFFMLEDLSRECSDGSIAPLVPSPCRFFLQGSCARGDRCKFNHSFINRKRQLVQPQEETLEASGGGVLSSGGVESSDETVVETGDGGDDVLSTIGDSEDDKSVGSELMASTSSANGYAYDDDDFILREEADRERQNRWEEEHRQAMLAGPEEYSTGIFQLGFDAEGLIRESAPTPFDPFVVGGGQESIDISTPSKVEAHVIDVFGVLDRCLDMNLSESTKSSLLVSALSYLTPGPAVGELLLASTDRPRLPLPLIGGTALINEIQKRLSVLAKDETLDAEVQWQANSVRVMYEDLKTAKSTLENISTAVGMGQTMLVGGFLRRLAKIPLEILIIELQRVKDILHLVATGCNESSEIVGDAYMLRGFLDRVSSDQSLLQSTKIVVENKRILLKSITPQDKIKGCIALHPDDVIREQFGLDADTQINAETLSDLRPLSWASIP